MPVRRSVLVYSRVEANMSDISAMFTKIFAILIVCLLLSLLLIAMRMLAADARRRGKPAVLVVLLALFHSLWRSCSGLYSVRNLWNPIDASFNYATIARNRAVRRHFEDIDGRSHNISQKGQGYRFWAMYVLASNFFEMDFPVIGRTRPKTGRLNHGRSSLPTIAHAIPA